VAYAWSGSELLLFGGRPSGSGATKDGFAYNPATGTWRQLASSGAPSARYDAFAAWTGDRLVIVGGSDANGAPLATAAKYDPIADAWSAVASFPAAARSAPRGRVGIAAFTGARALFAGGLGGGATFFEDGMILEPATNTWPAAIPAWPSMKAHEYGAAVWSGNELILWSGLDGGALTSAGERYKP
jgi:N-acetylneuraminic acid mutarotase